METMRQAVHAAIADPNVAVILIAAGILGIYAEFCVPGRILPGVLGGIFVLLGLSSIANLPINWVGVALLALAAALLVLESKTLESKTRWPRGLLGIAGGIAMMLGMVTLLAGPAPQPRIHWITAVGVSLPLASITVFLLRIAERARRNKAVGRGQSVTGEQGGSKAEAPCNDSVTIFTKTGGNRPGNG